MPPITRPNFFTNQFLQAKDLLDEQSYHVEVRKRWNRLLYTTPGVATGMTVTAAADNNGLIVGPGLAIDGNGSEILINEPLPVALASNAASSAVLSLTVQLNKVSVATGDTDANGNIIRFTETPVLTLFTSPNLIPADGTNVILAKVTLDASGKVAANGVDMSGRTNAGPKLPTHSVSLSSLNMKTFESDSAVSLAAGATSRIENIPVQPSKTSVFCLVDVYPTTPGGSLSWQWDISTKADGAGGLQVRRSVVVTNTSPNSLSINFHSRIVVINDV